MPGGSNLVAVLVWKADAVEGIGAIDAIVLDVERVSNQIQIPFDWHAAMTGEARIIPAIELTCDLNIAVVCFRIELHDATESIGVCDILEFPKGVSCEVLAWWRVSDGWGIRAQRERN